MEKYLAYDGINNEYEFFYTNEDAQDWLSDIFLDRYEGYHPDLSCCAIYELKQKVGYDIIANKKDYTDEEWQDEGYSVYFNEIWKHKFIEQ